MDRRTHRAGMALVAGLAMSLVASGAWAQKGGPGGPGGPDRRPREGRPLLSGPEVQDMAPPGVQGRFAPGQANAREGAGIIPPQEFMRAVRSLGQMSPESGLALTPEQGEQIRAIMQEFSQSLPPGARERLAGGPQGRGGPQGPGGQLQRRRGPGGPEAGAEGPEGSSGGEMRRRGPGGPEGRGRGPNGEPMAEGGPEAGRPGEGRGNPEMRQQMIEKIRGAQTRVWAVLTPEQTEHVKGELARMKSERDSVDGERRAMEYAKRRGAKGPDAQGPGGPGAGGPFGGPDAASDPEAAAKREEMIQQRIDRWAEEQGLPTGVREALKQMSPEERREFVRQMESRRRGAEGEGGGEVRRRRAPQTEPTRPE